MLTIVNYGMGNLRSVEKAFGSLGVPTKLTSDPEEVEKATALVVPGVGAFGQAMQNLREGGLIPVIRAAAEKGKPILGICLGMQILFETGEESPGVQGLGILAGTAPRLPDSKVSSADPGRFPGTIFSEERGLASSAPSGTLERIKIPHVGWNQIRLLAPDPLFEGISDGTFFYFVHSYIVRPADPTLVKAVCRYGSDFPAILRSDDVVACQFHPEKSGAAGLILLRNLIQIFKLNRGG
ncbi:MAG: imidazole glycerol phosphate synthase subunit HisH [Firmicutes bacterium]|nr:imidazole glycerol phosphate synthase subunit HisH [Bacillota bacterium]MCL5040076.1 imidazole glycerol phosphate synthase subunit HisH [Bacillota bacterium]